MRKDRGITLIEIIITAAIGLAILAAAVKLISDYIAAQNNSEKIHDLLLASETVCNQLTQDIRFADVFQPTATGFNFITHMPDGSDKIVSYTREPASPTATKRVVLKRNGKQLNPVSVYLIDDPAVAEDFVAQDINALDPAHPTLPPLILLTFTFEHAYNQGVRTTHETTTTISFRNHQVQLQ